MQELRKLHQTRCQQLPSANRTHPQAPTAMCSVDLAMAATRLGNRSPSSPGCGAGALRSATSLRGEGKCHGGA